MERDIYDEDHDAFRDVVKEFIKRYVTNEARERWDAEGEIDRATMLAAGESGLIGLSVPEEFGGAGMLKDYRFRAIINEEVIGAFVYLDIAPKSRNEKEIMHWVRRHDEYEDAAASSGSNERHS